MAALLVVWQVSTVATAYPDYFPYFNELVSDPQHVLVDSDLDWGQDLRRLERRLAQLKVPRVSLAYEGTADLQREMLPPFVQLPPRRSTRERMGRHHCSLTREARARRRHAWLDPYRPVERVGKTIDLYFIAP